MGRSVRNADRHLWALQPVIPVRKARKRFLEHTLLFAFRKTYPILTPNSRKTVGAQGSFSCVIYPGLGWWLKSMPTRISEKAKGILTGF